MIKVQNVVSLGCQITFLLALAQTVDAGDDLRASAQNPISSMVSLPLKLTADQGG